MKNCTHRSQRCRWSALLSIPVLSMSLLLVACGDNTSSNQENRDDTNLNSLVNGAISATELAARMECSDLERFKSVAHLSWRPAKVPGNEQHIEVTIFKDGFETERFESSKALSPEETSYLFEGVKGQALHRWRVVTVTENDLIFSETTRFEGVVCVGDVIAEQPPIPVQ